MSTVIVSLNLDTLVSSHEGRLDTTHQRRAWLWLAEQTVATFDGAAVLVPSATWSNTTYKATADTCSCKARGECWHKAAAATIRDAMMEDARYDLEADNAIWQTAYDASPAVYHAIAHHEASAALQATRAERKARAYADIAECFA